jgi:hypothetical protein
MAEKIRGINVKIGADTTALSSALKDVEKESRDIGRELNKVNQALKFSPKSTELLSQKQDLLKERISKTGEKLDALRKSQKQIEDQFKRGEIDDGQYRAFRREVVQSESKLDTFNRQLKETNRQARNAKIGFDDLKKAGGMLATGIAAVSAAMVAAGYVISREINRTMEYADKVDKLSQKMGLSAEATQEWTFVAEQNGTTLESLTNALARFQKNVGDADDGLTTATRSFKDLEVDIYDVNDNLRTMDDLFPVTIRKLAEMEDITKRNQIAMNLFGRGGKELIPILNQSTEDIEALVEQANDLDLVMSDEDIKSWVDFKDAAHAVTEEFNALRREMATELLPFLQSEFLPFIKDNLIPTLKKVGDFIAKGFGFSFAYDEDGSAEQAIRDIDDLTEAQSTLEEKQEELANAPDPKSIGFLKYSREERQNIIARRNTLESEIALLEYLIETRDWLNEKKENNQDAVFDIDEEGPTELETFLSDLDQKIEDYNFGQKLSEIGTTWRQEIEKLDREKAKKLIEAEDLGASKRTLDKIKYFYDKQVADIIKGAKDRSLEAEKKYQNELALLQKEGLEQELERLNQQEEAELEANKENIEALDEIRNKYNIKRQEVREKYAKVEIELEKKYQNELALLKLEGEEAELERLRQQEEKEIEQAEGKEAVIGKIQEKYRIERQQVKDKYNEQEKEAAEKLQNELSLLRKEGKEKELEQLDQWYEAEQEKAEGNKEALAVLEEIYLERKNNINEKYAEEEKNTAEKLQNELELLRKNGKGKELAELDQWYEAEQDKTEGNKEALAALEGIYNEKKLDIEEKFVEEEKKLEDEIKQNKFAINQISLEDYKAYLQERLKDYEEYTDEWLKLKQKIDDLEITPAEVESEYSAELELLKKKNETFGESFDFVAKKTELVKKALERLIETGNTDSEIFHNLIELYKELTAVDNEDIESLNWMTDAFVDLGLEIENANQKFTDWKDDLVNGLSEAIVQGESLSDVLSNIADQIATMVIKQGIVQPIVDWGLNLAGLAHEGAYVSPAGLIRDLPSYHTGGDIKPDERVIKVETGERVLSRNQNEAFESGEYGKQEINISIPITGMDTQDIMRALTKDGGAAVAAALGLDYNRNGVTRKIIKGGK